LYAGEDSRSLKLQTNSYGAPIKYQVVHISKGGIPFAKMVNKKGDLTGAVFSCINPPNLYTGSSFIDGLYEYRLDPDYVDSILLQDTYDPAVLHRFRQAAWKEISEHNKRTRVNTRTLSSINKFFEGVNAGDTLWTSHMGSYLVQNKQVMTRQDFRAKLKDNYTNATGPWVTVLTVLDKKNKVLQITADFFRDKALYKERPRTYKELKT
jgi:hypothetical protein